MEMLQTLFTISGPDRPGVLDDLSGVISGNEGNILDLRTTELRGRFAMLIHVAAGEGATHNIRQALADLAGYTGLHIDSAAATAQNAPDSLPYLLTASGPDRPKVIKQLTHLMKALNIGIDHVDTHTSAAGILDLSMTLDVPRSVPVTKVREFLGQLFSHLKLTWTLAAGSRGDAETVG